MIGTVSRTEIFRKTYSSFILQKKRIYYKIYFIFANNCVRRVYVHTGIWILKKKVCRYYMKYFIFFSFHHRFIYVSLFSSCILYSYRTEKYSDNEIVCNKDKYFFDFLFYFTFGCFMKICNIKIDEKGWDIGKVVKVCYCWFRSFLFCH